MAILRQPEDLIVCPPLAIIKHSQLFKESMNWIAWAGFMTNALVERASASMAVGAMTETLVLIMGDSPVLGSTI